jgi:hypothetical protein
VVEVGIKYGRNSYRLKALRILRYKPAFVVLLEGEQSLWSAAAHFMSYPTLNSIEERSLSVHAKPQPMLCTLCDGEILQGVGWRASYGKTDFVHHPKCPRGRDYQPGLIR